MKKRYDTGIVPTSRTPLRAPAVVAVSSRIARRTLVKRPFRKGAALLHEQAITETMLAPMALRISTWPHQGQDRHDEDAARHAKHATQGTSSNRNRKQP